MEFDKIKISLDCNFIKQNNDVVVYIEELLNNDNKEYMNLLSYKYSLLSKNGLSTYDITNIYSLQKFNIITYDVGSKGTIYKTSITNEQKKGEIYIFRDQYDRSLEDHYTLSNIIQRVVGNVFES